MFNNFTSILNNLDSIAQENLEEPKESATALRQKKKDEAGSLSDGNLQALGDGTPSVIPKNSSEASFVVVEQNDNHSDNTISPKSTISNGSLTDYVSASMSLDKLKGSEKDSSSKTSQPLDNDTRQKFILKDKEIEKLNRECLELESQNEGLKQEVREAWEAYKSSQEKFALREASYQEDMSELERAKSSDREGMTVHVQSMEKELESKRKELTAIRQEHERVLKVLHTSQEEAKSWKSSKSSLEEALAEAKANSNQNLQGIRDDLRGKDLHIETLQAEHSNAMRSAHERHDALEQANADLTSSLMSKEREISRLTLHQQQGSQGKEAGMEDEISKLRMQLDHAESKYSEEYEQRQSCLKRLRSIEQEADLTRNAWEDEKTILLSRISELSSKQDSVSSPGGKGNSNRPNDQGREEEINRLEDQIRSLGKQLLRKQESLEEYLSERAALKVRLQDSQRRCKKFEDQVTSLLESYIDPYDFESGNGISGGRRGEGGSLRKRAPPSGGGETGAVLPNRPLRATQDLEKLGVHAGPGVTKAVDMLDTWTMITGRFLRAYPLLRLAFVVYLLVIHLWAFALLAYHTHALDLDNENANAMTNNDVRNLVHNVSEE